MFQDIDGKIIKVVKATQNSATIFGIENDQLDRINVVLYKEETILIVKWCNYKHHNMHMKALINNILTISPT